ncbi:MAG: hypothetical protein ACLR8X_02365 [Gallintestinimicrobium sp.]
MFWTRLGSSVVLVVLALIFLISGGPVLGAVCLLAFPDGLLRAD